MAETISELIDKLTIVNTKLYNLLDRSVEVIKDYEGRNYWYARHDEIYKVAEQMHTLLRDNVALVKQRSMLKKEIDQRIDEAIKTGKNDVLLEVKKYG